MLAADELAALSDEQALDLIFSAGFSTAAEVSDISGRGVGMDVVRTTVEQIGGRVSLSSRVGAGTTVRLDLPLNIAMSRIMVVEAGGQVFGIPMDAVTETVRLTPERISQIKNNDGFVLRDRVVPICSLAELMNLPKKPASELAARLLVVDRDRREDRRPRGRRHSGPPGSGAQADAGSAVQRPRLCRHDLAGRRSVLWCST